MIVATIRLKNGALVELTAYAFKFADFDGAEIVSGDKYYVAKAVEKGAKKAARNGIKE